MNLTELNKKADILRNSGKEKEAVEIYRKLADEYDKAGDVANAGGALQMVGVCYKIAKDEKNSLAWLHKALDYFTKHNHTIGQGNAWRDIGIMYEYVGKYQAAEQALEKSAALIKDSNDQGAYGITVAKQGLVAMRQKQYDKAESLLDQALEITTRAQHWFMTLTTLEHLTELMILKNRLDEAEKYVDRMGDMLDHPQEEGHVNRRAEMLALQALIAQKRGQKERASELIGRARNIHKDADQEVKKQFSEKWYFKELAI